jgi:hypothetical protein
MVRISGVPLADGLQLDVAVSPKNDAAILDAARERFADAAPTGKTPAAPLDRRTSAPQSICVAAKPERAA